MILAGNTMLAAAEIVSTNCHDAIARITEQGYEIFYMIESNQLHQGRLLAEVRMRGALVATAEFQDDGSSCHCDVIDICDACRRKGIASALYVFAELIYKKQICNHWANDSMQTDLAKALWSQRNRPFGHHKGTCPHCG
jgi:hypothetical protein